jgi:hypothetical protein
MDLKKRYEEAAAGTNAGNAKTIGTAASPVTNFFDGVGRGQNNNAPDEYQEEFAANTPGDFRYGGGGKIPGTYARSSWKDIGLNKLDTLFANNAFTSIIRGDVRNAPNAVIHKFTPTANFASSLSEFARTKAQ